MLKLHYHPLSTFARRVRVALLEKDMTAELIELDMANKAQFRPEYLALNPYSRVPTLEDNGFVLYESTAILEYLEATHPQPPLLPSEPQPRALVAMHMKLCDIQFARPVATIIFPKRFLPKERWRLEAMAKAKEEIEKHLSILERQLEGKEYLVDGRFTLAEVCYIPFVEFSPLMEVTLPSSVAAWTRRILDRPSARETKPTR